MATRERDQVSAAPASSQITRAYPGRADLDFVPRALTYRAPEPYRANVSQDFTVPDFRPVVSHRTRCSDEP